MASVIARKGQGGNEGKTHYYVRYRTADGGSRTRAAANKKKAEALKAKVEHQLNEGSFVDIKDITFGELAARWLDGKKATIRPKVYATYKPIVNRIVKVFGARKVRTIRQEEIERFALDMLKAHSPHLTKRTLSIFSAIMTKACQWGYAGRNPVQYVERPKSRKREIDCLEPGEIRRLIDAADKRDRALIMFACLTGCRQSEILGLRWQDVDLEAGRVYIRQVLQWKSKSKDSEETRFDFFEPKSQKSRRTVELPPVLVSELKRHQLEQMAELDSNEHNLVFVNRLGRPMDSRNCTTRILEPSLRRAGLRRVSFHSLRHSFVSLLINQGENVKTVSELVGHSSATVTLTVYSHLFAGDKAAAVQRLQAGLFGEAEPPGDLAAEREFSSTFLPHTGPNEEESGQDGQKAKTPFALQDGVGRSRTE